MEAKSVRGTAPLPLWRSPRTLTPATVVELDPYSTCWTCLGIILVSSDCRLQTIFPSAVNRRHTIYQFCQLTALFPSLRGCRGLLVVEATSDERIEFEPGLPGLSTIGTTECQKLRDYGTRGLLLT